VNANSLRVKCPNCSETIELTIRGVLKTLSSTVDVKEAMEEFVDHVDITESDDSIVITPRGFLEKKLWYQINNSLEKLGAEWVSAGKESRWVIRK
jgi:hypothetical protein